MLADLPFKIYLTTSPYTFIEEALRRAGKQPRTEICRWRRELDSIDSVIDDTYKPSTHEPLIYHLHGLDRYADSLVLTEDDYLEFLVNVVQGQGNNAVDRIHALVRKTLSDLDVSGRQEICWRVSSLNECCFFMPNPVRVRARCCRPV